MIVVGTSVPSWKAKEVEDCPWLSHLDTLREDAQAAGHELRVLLVAEDYGGDESCRAALERIIERVRFEDGEIIRFSLRMPTDADRVTWESREPHVDCARNLISWYAHDVGADWLLCLDSDIEPPPHLLRDLLALDHPLCGANVPEYCLDGPRVDPWPDHLDESWDVRVHWNTAGCLLIERNIFRALLWKRDRKRGLSDDPAYADEARSLFGIECWVRHDIEAHHIVPLSGLESRYSADELAVRR